MKYDTWKLRCYGCGRFVRMDLSDTKFILVEYIEEYIDGYPRYENASEPVCNRCIPALKAEGRKLKEWDIPRDELDSPPLKGST